ncbi:MAG: YgcG family protein [Syntrophaceae bacterium]|nr:YgcG family protein [Syntrophaceae bacterium]
MKSFLAGFLCLLLSPSVFALAVPERPEGRVTDRTGTLTRDQIQALEKKLSAFEKETTNQIAVLMIPSLEGDSLEEFSIRLAEKWKIGQKGRNNGVILLIVKNDRKLRIEVGYGLEGALPDALAGTIIRNEIAPRFKEGQFFQGIETGVNAIISATKGEYRAGPRKKESPMGLWFPLLILGAFIFFFELARSRARRRYYHSGSSRGWHSGGGFFGGGPFLGGSGGWSSGGDSFSGGGGDFGGGGASGNW